ncbi:MAG: 3-hydroxyacyl-ACP dehydratase FabZ [Gammaproteobacteria bacterium]|nr:3-hydroxyacyl-ACP dehydratase FabZ [Gammaproteobacteria bacterium]
MDIHELRKYLPHRFPFLLLDRVLDYKVDATLTALKNVTINEPFFPGHFPQQPVMPGVLILESMAQACAILSMKTLDQIPNDGSLYYFAGIDKARFRRPVEPGDQLHINVSIKRKMRGIWVFEVTATVDGEECCSAELMCAYKKGTAGATV